MHISRPKNASFHTCLHTFPLTQSALLIILSGGDWSHLSAWLVSPWEPRHISLRTEGQIRFSHFQERIWANKSVIWIFILSCKMTELLSKPRLTYVLKQHHKEFNTFFISCPSCESIHLESGRFKAPWQHTLIDCGGHFDSRTVAILGKVFKFHQFWHIFTYFGILWLWFKSPSCASFFSFLPLTTQISR